MAGSGIWFNDPTYRFPDLRLAPSSGLVKELLSEAQPTSGLDAFGNTIWGLHWKRNLSDSEFKAVFDWYRQATGTIEDGASGSR